MYSEVASLSSVLEAVMVPVMSSIRNNPAWDYKQVSEHGCGRVYGIPSGFQLDAVY